MGVVADVVAVVVDVGVVAVVVDVGVVAVVVDVGVVAVVVDVGVVAVVVDVGVVAVVVDVGVVAVVVDVGVVAVVVDVGVVAVVVEVSVVVEVVVDISVVVVTCWHPSNPAETVLFSNVIAPVRATRNPLVLNPVKQLTLTSATTFPEKFVPTPNVADEPTRQNTEHARAPPARTTLASGTTVVSVDPILKIQTAFGSPFASSVTTPLIVTLSP